MTNSRRWQAKMRTAAERECDTRQHRSLSAEKSVALLKEANQARSRRFKLALMDARVSSEAWLCGVAKVIEALNTSAFGENLFSAMSEILAFDVMIVRACRRGNHPTTLYRKFSADHVACFNKRRSRPLGPDAFESLNFDSVKFGAFAFGESRAPGFEADYRDESAVQNGVGIVCHLKSAQQIILLLARSVERPDFTADDLRLIASVEPIVRSLVVRQWNHLSLARGEQGCAPSGSDKREAVTPDPARGILTRRETAIVSMILDGYNNESISLDLNISIGTVKVHRKNIYRKLQISSQVELFRMFFRHGGLQRATPLDLETKVHCKNDPYSIGDVAIGANY